MIPLPIVDPVEPVGTTRRRRSAGPINLGQNEVGRSQPSRKHRRRRALVLVAVHLVIALHIAYFCFRGRAISPVEPSETMYALELGYINAGAIFFVAAILATAVYGRFFCGWACHLVALQDLCSHLLERLGIRLRPVRSRALATIPLLLAFYMFVWPTMRRMWLAQSRPGLSNHLITSDFWATFPNLFFAALTFIVCGGLIVCLLGNKGFCTYVCPYGAIFGIADRMAFGRIHVTSDCTGCGQCTSTCTSNVTVHAQVRDHGMVLDPGCMKCMDCVDVCPEQALYYGLGQRNKEITPGARSALGAKKYDFTMGEELLAVVVAAAATFALRGLYDGPPLLLSVACGVITGWLAIVAWRSLLERTARIQNLRLHGFRRAVLLVALLAWSIFLGHSFLVQYHRHRGTSEIIQVPVSWEDALFQPQKQLTAKQRQAINAAHESLKTSDDWGLLPVGDVKLALAWTSLLRDERMAAKQYLRAAAEIPGSEKPAREMLAELEVSPRATRAGAQSQCEHCGAD